MENLSTPQYLSKTVEALIAESHPLTEKLKKIACAFCTQSVWSITEGSKDGKFKDIECFCLKTHMPKWNAKWDGTSSPLIISCDGFTNQPLTDE